MMRDLGNIWDSAIYMHGYGSYIFCKMFRCYVYLTSRIASLFVFVSLLEAKRESRHSAVLYSTPSEINSIGAVRQA